MCILAIWFWISFLFLPIGYLRRSKSCGDHCGKCYKLANNRQMHVFFHIVIVNNDHHPNRMYSCLGDKLPGRPVRDYLGFVNWDGKNHHNCWTKCCSWLSAAIINTLNQRETWGQNDLFHITRFSPSLRKTKQEFKEGVWGGNHRGTLLPGLFWGSLSAAFFIHCWPACLGVGLPVVKGYSHIN